MHSARSPTPYGRVTQKLREERHDTIAGYIDKAADQIDNWSRRLRDKDIDELMSDVQRLARRQPAVFISSAFALGLVGARFFKSSRQQDQGGYGNESRRTRYGGSAGRAPSTTTAPATETTAHVTMRRWSATSPVQALR